jgi:hypothetical protein
MTTSSRKLSMTCNSNKYVHTRVLKKAHRNRLDVEEHAVSRSAAKLTVWFNTTHYLPLPLFHLTKHLWLRVSVVHFPFPFSCTCIPKNGCLPFPHQTNNKSLMSHVQPVAAMARSSINCSKVPRLGFRFKLRA